jgi:hypothetical protein
MHMQNKRTEKHESIRNGLQKGFVPYFDQHVEDYKISSTVHHGRGYVSYVILADLIKAGWRHSAEAIEDE